jgi:hypothetical protein
MEALEISINFVKVDLNGFSLIKKSVKIGKLSCRIIQIHDKA